MAANSTQIITDLNTAIANQPYSATSIAASTAAAGPIMDTNAMVKSVLLNAQEMVEKLAYLLGGSMVQGSLTAPTGGVIAGGGADNATYNLLVGIYQILK